MILVIDGQGGRMGAMLVKKIKELSPGADVMAVGTNSLATSAMLRAGADRGATGENPAVCASVSADVIAGPVGIVVADSILGEVTEKMAAAVGRSGARKVLIPVPNCGITVVGAGGMKLGDSIDAAAAEAVK